MAKQEVKQAKKYLSFNDLVEQEKGPIWVVNTVQEVVDTGGEVLLTTMVQGANKVERIPRTWLPIELTRSYSRKALLESGNLADAMSKGILKAVTEEHAQSLLAQPGAKKEQARLDQHAQALEAATASKGISKNVTVTTGDQDQDEINSSNERGSSQADTRASAASKTTKFVSLANSDDSAGEYEEEDTVSANFKAWVMKLNAMEDEDEVDSETKMRGDLTADEAIYLYENIEHSGIEEKLGRLLRKQGIIE